MKDSRYYGALSALVLAGLSAHSLAAPASSAHDAQRQVETALDQFAEAKTDAQRATVVEFLQQLDRRTAAGAVIDHIEKSRTGQEATRYNELLEKLKPESCQVLLAQFGQVADAESKGKLAVSLRHCELAETVAPLTAALGDKRAVHFEAHGKNPRRVCDIAYDELFLKLRSNPKFGLDAGKTMRGLIRENTPLAKRDAWIEKLSDKLAAEPAPVSSPSPAASPRP